MDDDESDVSELEWLRFRVRGLIHEFVGAGRMSSVSSLSESCAFMGLGLLRSDFKRRKRRWCSSWRERGVVGRDTVSS